MATDKADDLTAERAVSLEVRKALAEKVKGLLLNGLTHEENQIWLANVDAFENRAYQRGRQAALREAVTKIRQRGDEYMRDCEAKDAAGKKYRDTYEMRRVNSGRAWAFKDLADELDRLASEGG